MNPREKKLTKVLTYLIGRLTLEQSALEYEIEFASWSYLKTGNNRKDQMATSQLSLQQLSELLLGLFELSETRPQTVKRLKSILGGAIDASQKRNPLIHGNWSVTSTRIGDFISLHGHEKPRRGKMFETMDTIKQFQDIRAVINEISKVRKELDDFFFDLAIEAYKKQHPKEFGNRQ